MQCVKGQIFTTNGCRVVYVRKLAQLFLNNLYRTENTLSGAWFYELLSVWSKRFLGPRTLRVVVKLKSLFAHTPNVGQLVFFFH